MFKLSHTMINVLRLFADGNPHSIENGLGIFNVRWPTLVSLQQRGLIRPERKSPHQRCYTMRFLITPQGKLEVAKRGIATKG